MRKIFQIVILIFIGFTIQAQDTTEPWRDYEKLLINANLTIGVPLNKFRQNVGTAGIGGGGAVLILIKNTSIPIYTGFELNGVTYDRLADRFSLLIDGYYTNVELETKTIIFAGHAILQIAPCPNWGLQPYFQGMFGLKNLFTKTSLIELDSGNDETLDRYVEGGDWAFSYGGTFGLAIPIPIYEYVGFKLDIKCSFLKGVAADYYVRRSDNGGQNYQDPIDAFEIKNSATDMLYPQIGMQFIFGKVSGRLLDQYEE